MSWFDGTETIKLQHTRRVHHYDEFDVFELRDRLAEALKEVRRLEREARVGASIEKVMTKHAGVMKRLAKEDK